MARSDYAALLTEPASEYLAQTELERYGLCPYLPQLRKRHPTKTGRLLTRRYPLFPRYILIRFDDAYDPAVRMARGVYRHRPVLADASGHPWRAPQPVVDAIRDAESAGEFDEILTVGDHVKLPGVLAAVAARMNGAHGCRAELLIQMLGGVVRASAPAAQVMRA